jgi:hypothetical protein
MMEWSYDDFVTGERLQALAEVTVLTRSIFEFHASLQQSGVRKVVGFPGSHEELVPDERSIAALPGHRSIFVYTHLLRSFVARILPRLEQRFVLITHNSDHGVGTEFEALLADPRLVHCFAQNTLIRHPKLTALPIGVANAQWPHGNLPALLAAANRPRAHRRDVVYVNFDVRTNPPVRVPLLQRLQSSPLAWAAPPRPFADYLEDMASCRWVVSPPGNGVDCHRTWEALYLGATPVVARTPHGAALHDGLPIVQLEDLGVLDRAQLERMQWPADPASLAPLRMSHWRALVQRQVERADPARRAVPA